MSDNDNFANLDSSRRVSGQSDILASDRLGAFELVNVICHRRWNFVNVVAVSGKVRRDISFYRSDFFINDITFVKRLHH